MREPETVQSTAAVCRALTTVLLGALPTVLVGCSDAAAPTRPVDRGRPTSPAPAPAPSSTPRLVVTAAMEGLPPDTDGFTVSLGDGPGRHIEADDGTLGPGRDRRAWFGDLDPGGYEVAIADVSEGCRVVGDNPRWVEIRGPDSLVFEVECRGQERLADRLVYGARGGTYVIRADGTSRARLSRRPWRGGDVSADGRRVVVAGEGLHLLRADGARIRTLREAGGRDPAWSPDDRWIAYSEGEEQADLYLIRPDGTGRRQLTSGPERDRHPSWSPDGRTVAFERKEEGSFDLYTVRVDGRDLRRLTAGERREAQPAWSPGGGRIAFVEGPLDETEPGDQRIRILDLETDGMTTVVGTWRQVCGPAWSPAGDQIAFQGVNHDHNWSWRSPEPGTWGLGGGLAPLSATVRCAGRLYVSDDVPMRGLHEVVEGGGAPAWSPAAAP